MKKQLVFLCFLFVYPIYGLTVNFSPSESNPTNPHRGFMLWGTGVGVYNALPNNYYNSHIYHIYIPWRLAEPTDDEFRWDLIEEKYLKPITDLDADATFVLRLLADYPDGVNSAINAHYGDRHEQPNRDYPGFIEGNYYDNCNGDGPGYAANWNTVVFEQQATSLIYSYAKKFDGDPRITAIQLGLLGLWGEWHQSGCETLAPNDKIKATIMNTYLEAFQKTPLQIRYVSDNAGGNPLGFYEDYFPSFTANCNNYQLPNCDDEGNWNLAYGFANVSPLAEDNWKLAPVSGESPLQIQKDSWVNNADVIRVVKDYHFSFLGPAGKHEENGFQKELSILQDALGYRFEAISASLVNSQSSENEVEINFKLRQAGVAPSYIQTRLQLDWLDESGKVVLTQKLEGDLSALLPNETIEVSSTIRHGLPKGNYQLRAYLSMPDRKTNLAFANQNMDSQRRLILGSITIPTTIVKAVQPIPTMNYWGMLCFITFLILLVKRHFRRLRLQ